VPAGCYLHPFESRSPQGRRAPAMADVQARGLPRAIYTWTAAASCACLSPAKGLGGGERALDKERAGIRRNVGEAAAKTMFRALQPGGRLPGCKKLR
jgi:hypothetical protein